MLKLKTSSHIKFFVFLFFLISSNLTGQIKAINGIQYQQITNFAEDLDISNLRMSVDGSTIVFVSRMGDVKVHTISTDGIAHREVYNFGNTSRPIYVDISGNGEKIIFTDGIGEIFIANIDGSDLRELATSLPNDLEPNILQAPRITKDGSQVFFVHTDGRRPDVHGVWKVNANNTGLKQVFSFTEFWEDALNKTEEIYSSAGFSTGFDISYDGSIIVIGTNVLKREVDDYYNGNAYYFDGEDFYPLGDYRLGSQPLATNNVGSVFIFIREEFNPELNENQYSLYAAGASGHPPIKIVEGLTWPSFGAVLQLNAFGDRAVALASGNLPISMVSTVTDTLIDLVNCDEISSNFFGFQMSQCYSPAMNGNGNFFCFISYSSISQIWTARLMSNGIACTPTITDAKFDPDYITHDKTVNSTFEIKAKSPGKEIQGVYFDVFQNGKYCPRAIYTSYPFRKLYDDGTHGDEYAEDYFYTNNSVTRQDAETSIGSYTIRISATDGEKITSVDYRPFMILEKDPTNIVGKNKVPFNYSLEQNYPNPFNAATTIKYSIPEKQRVVLKVFDIIGKEVATLVNGIKEKGDYKVEFTADDLASGIYLYKFQAGRFSENKKLLLVK